MIRCSASKATIAGGALEGLTGWTARPLVLDPELRSATARTLANAVAALEGSGKGPVLLPSGGPRCTAVPA